MSAIPSPVPETSATDEAKPVAVTATRSSWLPERVQGALLGVAFPIVLVLLWHQLVVTTGTKLVPTPYQVAVMMWDFTFGGIHNDAFSGTILTHLLASMQRVYGGFALAIAVGIPLGLFIGKVKVIRQMLDPTLSQIGRAHV